MCAGANHAALQKLRLNLLVQRILCAKLSVGAHNQRCDNSDNKGNNHQSRYKAYADRAGGNQCAYLVNEER